ncbi:MAG: nucleotidyltransferase family protein [Myxococcota bacterium]|nr:nucleotidyltransferase family protein [Myxococcota bacterium]
MNIVPLTTTLKNWFIGVPTRPAVSPDLVDWARPRRLLGLLYHIQSDLNESNYIECQSAWLRNQASHLLRLKILAEIWPSDWALPVAIKGTDYIENLYGDPGARWCADMDLLIPATQLSSLGERLGQLYPDRVHERPLGRAKNATGQVQLKIDEMLFEFHSQPGPDHFVGQWANDIIARSQPGQDESSHLRFPSAVDRLCIWLVNQSKTRFVDGLCALIDFAMIVRAISREGKLALEKAEQTIHQRRLENAFHLAIYRLRLMGISSYPHPIDTGPLHAFMNRFTVGESAPVVIPGRLRQEALKFWLCPAHNRPKYVTYSMTRLAEVLGFR